MAIEFANTKKVIASQKQGDQLNKLYYETSADQVKMADGQDVQTALSNLTTVVNDFLTGADNNDDVINRLSELVQAIQNNKGSIDALVADKVAKSDIINDLTTGGTDKVLSAEQGKALKALIDQINTDLGNVHVFANADDLDRLSVVNGEVAVDGVVMKEVVSVATMPETMPTNLADGGLLIVG